MFDPVWRVGLLAAACSLGLAASAVAGLGDGKQLDEHSERGKRIGHVTIDAVSLNGRGACATVGRGNSVVLKLDFRSYSTA